MAPLKKPKKKPTQDLALIHSPTEDGEGARILRLRDGELSAGEVRPLREGQAANSAELVRLSPVAEGSPVCEVEVLHGGKAATTEATPARRASSPGPARVSNAAFRRNWNQVFAKRTGSGLGRDKADKDLNLN